MAWKSFCQAAACAALLAVGAGSGRAGPITVDIYRGHTAVGGGAPYSGLAGSFTSDDILFATNTGYDWHPFGLPDFGADITGYLAVAADGTYTFTLDSDDGSLLFINEVLVVDNGGAHAPQVRSGSAFLAYGFYPFRVQFFEDFGGPSGVDLRLPPGVAYTAVVQTQVTVPEPATLALIGLSLLGVAVYRRRAG